MKKWLVIALLSLPVMGRAEAWLTAAPSHNFEMGNGGNVGLDISQPLSGPWSFDPHFGITSAEGFRDHIGVFDLTYKFSPRLSLSTGFMYDDYRLYGASPTIDHDVHTTLKVRLW